MRTAYGNVLYNIFKIFCRNYLIIKKENTTAIHKDKKTLRNKYKICNINTVNIVLK